MIFRSRYGIGKVSRSSRTVGARHYMRKKKNKRMVSWVKRLATFGIGVFVLGIIIFSALIFILSKQIPDVDSLTTYIPAETTKIISADGIVLAELHREENRILVPIEDISPLVQKSVIAMEDSNFFNHHGLDFKAILRALIKDIRAGSFVEGGSTLTQQLAKNLFFTKQKKIIRKLSEAIMAVQIEKRYTKTEIIEMYLNQVYWGHNAYGIESAARYYFDKESKNLTLAESAMLVGMLKGPELYSPFRSITRSKTRQKLVLNRMAKIELITQEEADLAYQTEIVLRERKRLRYKAPYFTSHVLKELIDMYGEEATYTSGMKVYTTLNYSYQKVAEEVVEKYVEIAKKPNWVGGQKVPSLNYNQAAILAIDPANGHILTMHGGADFLGTMFNRTTQAKRQPGSAFKPFVYLTALSKGFSPGSFIDDTPVTFNTTEGPYSPHNYTLEYEGPISLRRALQKSINVVSIKLNHLIGPGEIVKTAKKIGIESPLRPVLSLPLGANEVTMMELTSAYGVLANYGRRVEPFSIVRIEDRDGLALYQHKPIERTVYDDNEIAALIEMMEGVVKYGTGRNARIPRPMAGKTGTTSDYKDAWFFGFIPQMVTSAWVGNDDNAQMNRVTGGGIPAAMWREFMNEATKDIPARSFRSPRGMVVRNVNRSNGKLANQFTPEELVDAEKYWRGSEPTEEDGPQFQGKDKSSTEDVLNFFGQ